MTGNDARVIAFAIEQGQCHGHEVQCYIASLTPGRFGDGDRGIQRVHRAILSQV